MRPGRYDLVIDPSNLFLTIHESIGHATEYDRAIGYEAAYAGTSFATPDLLGTLQYGSAGMHVTGDRTARHGLATIGYDDDGVAGQSWDLIRDGLLVGYQLDRVFARKLGLDRSNGCAYADSPGHIQIQRMANVSLQPDPDGGSTDDLISGVEDGIYIVGDKSWSIDMQRYNFQFTGQRFYRIKGGRLEGQLKDVAYQATTTDFWGAMDGVGGPQTYVLGGAFNCGKGQPGQVGAGLARLPVGPFPRDQRPQRCRGGWGGMSSTATAGSSGSASTGLGGTAALLSPQQIVDAALAASRSDGCVVVVQARSEANVRWANNTVTTSGFTTGLDWFVVAVRGSRRRGRVRLGGGRGVGRVRGGDRRPRPKPLPRPQGPSARHGMRCRWSPATRADGFGEAPAATEFAVFDRLLGWARRPRSTTRGPGTASCMDSPGTRSPRPTSAPRPVCAGAGCSPPARSRSTRNPPIWPDRPGPESGLPTSAMWTLRPWPIR